MAFLFASVLLCTCCWQKFLCVGTCKTGNLCKTWNKEVLNYWYLTTTSVCPQSVFLADQISRSIMIWGLCVDNLFCYLSLLLDSIVFDFSFIMVLTVASGLLLTELRLLLFHDSNCCHRTCFLSFIVTHKIWFFSNQLLTCKLNLDSNNPLK